MKNIKRLLVTFLTAVICSISFQVTAFASEDTQAVSAVVSESTELKEDAAIEDEAKLSEEKLAEGSEEELTGEIDPVDDYETFVDEQGQVYYIEKEPEPVVIKEQPEEEQQATQEAKEKSKEEERPSYSEKDLRLLSSLIYAEAGNQSYNGMLAVANVVLNRVKSDVYYHVDSIKEVIYDKKWSVQFAVTIKSSKTGLSMLDKALNSYDTGKFTGGNPEAEKKAMKKAIKAAKAALQGENNIGNYLCFNAINKSTSRIKKRYPDYQIIGDHIFYRTK